MKLYVNCIDTPIYKQYYKTIHTTAYTQTEEAESMTGLSLTRAPELTTPQVINRELFQSFLTYLDATPKTIETYTKAIRQFYKYLEEKEISQPSREDVIEFREALKLDHKPATVQTYIIAVRLFFQWTDTAGLYPDIARHVKGAKLTTEHKKDYLTSSQVKAILKKIDRSDVQGRRDFAIFALMVTGGLRDIEVNRANIEDLRTLGDNTVLYIQGKGRSERAEYIKITPEVERAIRASLADRTDTAGSQPLFISLSNNSKGSRISTRSISGLVKHYFIQAGYKSDRLTAHSLRHTAVTLSLLGGKKLEEVQQFARHSKITTTQIYAHNLDRAKNNCEATIAKAIF